MHVKILQITVYEDDGWGAYSANISEPDWVDIEYAIRSLNRFTHPFIWMYRSKDVNNSTLPDFEVIGGDGVFAMQGRQNDSSVMYFNPTGTEEQVEIWTSDQGADLSDKNICREIGVVLEAARYLFEHGELDPRLQWRKSS